MSQRRSSRLFSPRRKRRYGCLTVAALFVAALVLTLSLNALSNRYVRLENRSVTVLNLPRELENFTILHLSDLNGARLGDAQENLREALGKEAYQAVALSGDMVGKSGDIRPLLEIKALFPLNVPVFFIAGDADPAPLLAQPHGDGEVKAEYIRALEEAGLTYLESPVRMEYDGRAVWFTPGDAFMLDLQNAAFALKEQLKALDSAANPLDAAVGAQRRHAEHRLDIIGKTMEAKAQMKSGDAIIALMHHPPDSEQLTQLSQLSREEGLPAPSLFLAGQFNNGQVRLPGLGILYVREQPDGRGGFLPGDEGFTGLSITKGFPVYVSPGLGISTYYPLPLRLFNRPAATLIHLTARMTR